MPLLWQYFSCQARQSKADELFCAPKGIGPSAVVDFSCKSASSEGAEEGAIGAIMDPRRCGQSRPCAS
jgi:hypothetical protein